MDPIRHDGTHMMIIEAVTDTVERLAREGVAVASGSMNRASLSCLAASLGWTPPAPTMTNAAEPGVPAHLRWVDPRKGVASLTLDLPQGQLRVEAADLGERHCLLYGATGDLVAEIELSA